MLTLTRRVGERIAIGSDIEVTVVSVVGNRVRLGIRAPREVAVHRAELLERVGEENRASVAKVVEEAARAGHQITFPEGLLGLGSHTTFLLCDVADESPIRCLVSCEDPSMQLLVVDAEQAWPGYPVDVARSIAGVGEDSAVALVLRVPASGGPTTANLMAPLVIEVEARVGRQVVIEDRALSTAAVVGQLG
jgi:carbon storage regulator